MTDDFNYDFAVGPADDAEDVVVMRIGLDSRKRALQAFKGISDIITKYGAECSTKESISQQWHGMISLAAYSLAITQSMLVQVGWHTTEGLKAEDSLDFLSSSTKQIAQKFIDSMKQGEL